MSFEVTSLKGSGKDIIQRVMNAQSSQLLIPPKLKGQSLDIDEPPPNGKYIGLFSSGTTSKSKCIWNSFENLKKNAAYSAQAFDIETHHLVLMMAMPWHVAGFSWMLMAEELDCEYFFITTQKGDHDLWLRTVQDIKPDYLLTVPAVLRTLYDEDWFVEHIAYGGYPIKFDEFSKLSPHCSFMYQGYGQTEAGGLISSHKKRSTVLPFNMENFCQGKAIKGAELLCEGNKESHKPIYIKSETAFKNNFYDSGDVGYKDEEGNIYVIGRFVASDTSIQPNKKEML